MSFTLAIVGRPNVGKSTLFNRLVGKRLALVDDQPGVTRDLREGDAKLMDMRFTVIDTAGLEEVTDDSLQGRMRRLTERLQPLKRLPRKRNRQFVPHCPAKLLEVHRIHRQGLFFGRDGYLFDIPLQRDQRQQG